MLKVIDAIKKIYPKIKSGFMYWETRQDGKVWEKKIDGLFWENTEFAKPTWEQIEEKLAEIKLDDEKAEKIAECKLTRDNTPFAYTPTGTTKNFSLKLSDISAIVARSNRLVDATLVKTATWPDINGVRHELTKEQFRSMRNHLDAHDETLFNWYDVKKKEIKACQSLEALEKVELTFKIK